MCVVGSIGELHDEISRKIDSTRGDIAGVVELLRQNVGLGKLIEPTDDAVWETLLVALNKLLPNGMMYPASSLTVWLYHHICEQQKISSRRYHKGIPTYQAGLLYLNMRQLNVALWFVLLAFIEDVISKVDNLAGALADPAASTLRTIFNIPMALLNDMAYEAAHRNLPEDIVWHYPEELAVRLELEDLLPDHLTSGANEIPLNPHYVTLLRERLDEVGISTTEKGDRLEYLAAYLLKTLPGAHVVPKVKTSDHEVDLIVTQRTAVSSYLVDILGRAFLVECKNWEKPVGVEKLNHFVSKMRFHRCMCGILFAKSGISGERREEKRDANLTRLRWFHQDGCVVLVVSDEDILAVTDRSVSFGKLLLRKYEDLRFRS